MRVLGLTIFITMIHWITCLEDREMYSSTDQLVKLLGVGRELEQNLTEYIAAEEAILEKLKKTLLELSAVTASVDSADGLEEYVSNPLTAYRLVRNMRSRWSRMEETLGKSPLPEFLALMKLMSEALPTDRDVDGIALGLLRLQDTYQLLPQSLMGAAGQQESSLGPDETFHIAMVAYENQKFSLYMGWMLETLRQLELGSLAASLLHMDHLPTTHSFIQQLLTQGPSEVQGVLQQMYQASVQQGLIPELDHPSMHLLTRTGSFSNAYEALCRGQGITMPPERQKRLFCRYSRGGGGVSSLYAPFKEQDEWDSPRIVRYVDLISDQEIDVIKTLARPKLYRAKVMDHGTGKKYATETRVSKSGWLADEEDLVIGNLNQKLSAATGLDMTVAESLQVANYGIGGQYEPHFDSRLANDTDLVLKGNRIATILIYMSDVRLGGATVFPDAGAALKPQKGSAVVWYNLLRNGKEDDRTLHAACPVFIGSKWVANKWVRERGQEFRRRCSLSPSE
ncbi:prolyl 4-hydroxylase subunit alpha-2-like [Engraulis encrasicolus]|uniref:prolyl 4-hydroxylase subunit alpha-2-like n=1 Tax=Engraulis encrasicolus TaxID=184585 RepID=UPI002FCF28F7